MKTINIASEIEKLVYKLDKDKDYVCSDIELQGHNAFQWVFKYKGDNMRIIFQNLER